MKGNSDSPTFHEAQPERIMNRVVQIPGLKQTTSLTYDFKPDTKMESKEELLSMVVSTVGLNNNWEFWDYKKIKPPSGTLTREDEYTANQE